MKLLPKFNSSFISLSRILAISSVFFKSITSRNPVFLYILSTSLSAFETSYDICKFMFYAIFGFSGLSEVTICSILNPGISISCGSEVYLFFCSICLLDSISFLSISISSNFVLNMLACSRFSWPKLMSVSLLKAEKIMLNLFLMFKSVLPLIYLLINFHLLPISRRYSKSKMSSIKVNLPRLMAGSNYNIHLSLHYFPVLYLYCIPLDYIAKVSFKRSAFYFQFT